jgi:hypothetical protein
MLASLAPCPSCARHVRVAETSCPFCRAPLTARAPRRVPDLSRLSRAAQVAFGAALAAACASDPGPGPVAPAYGAPAPVEDGGATSPVEPAPGPVEPGEPGGGEGGGSAVEPSPAPPPEQGPPEGAVRPLYGVPPPPQ